MLWMLMMGNTESYILMMASNNSSTFNIININLWMFRRSDMMPNTFKMIGGNSWTPWWSILCFTYSSCSTLTETYSGGSIWCHGHSRWLIITRGRWGWLILTISSGTYSDGLITTRGPSIWLILSCACPDWLIAVDVHSEESILSLYDIFCVVVCVCYYLCCI